MMGRIDTGTSKMDAVTWGNGDGETWDGVLGILDFIGISCCQGLSFYTTNDDYQPTIRLMIDRQTGLGRGRNTGQEFM